MTNLEDNPVNPAELTEFNSNAATLERIDRALRNAATASMDNDFYLWYKMLAILRREALVKKKHVKNCKIDEKDCERCTYDITWTKLRNNIELVKDNSSKGLQPSDRKKLDCELDEYEMTLREFMDSKGMLLRDGQSAMTKFRTGG